MEQRSGRTVIQNLTLREVAFEVYFWYIQTLESHLIVSLEVHHSNMCKRVTGGSHHRTPSWSFSSTANSFATLISILFACQSFPSTSATIKWQSRHRISLTWRFASSSSSQDSNTVIVVVVLSYYWIWIITHIHIIILISQLFQCQLSLPYLPLYIVFLLLIISHYT